MTNQEFILLVKDMRDYQKLFFEARRKGLESKDALQMSKQLERQVDKAIKEGIGEKAELQGDLFENHYKAELTSWSLGPPRPCGIRMHKIGSEQFPLPVKIKNEHYEKKKLI